MNTKSKYATYKVVYETDRKKPCRMYINSEKQNLVASFYDDPETVAMFQLFAAAPEMLEALERMMANSVYDTDLDKYTIEMSGFVANINKSIIAKAKGEQP